MEGLISLAVLLLILYVILKNIWEILGVATTIGVGFIGLIIVYIIWTRVLHFALPDVIDYDFALRSNIDNYIDAKDKEYNTFVYKDINPKEVEKETGADGEKSLKLEEEFESLRDDTDVEDLMEELTEPEKADDIDDSENESKEGVKDKDKDKDAEDEEEPEGIMKYIKVPEYGSD